MKNELKSTAKKLACPLVRIRGLNEKEFFGESQIAKESMVESATSTLATEANVSFSDSNRQANNYDVGKNPDEYYMFTTEDTVSEDIRGFLAPLPQPEPVPPVIYRNPIGFQGIQISEQCADFIAQQNTITDNEIRVIKAKRESFFDKEIAKAKLHNMKVLSSNIAKDDAETVNELMHFEVFKAMDNHLFITKVKNLTHFKTDKHLINERFLYAIRYYTADPKGNEVYLVAFSGDQNINKVYYKVSENGQDDAKAFARALKKSGIFILVDGKRYTDACNALWKFIVNEAEDKEIPDAPGPYISSKGELEITKHDDVFMREVLTHVK